MNWLFVISTLVCTVLGRVAMGAALGTTGLFILLIFSNGATQVGAFAVFGFLTKFTLSAIPIFLVMGEIIVESGLSSRVYQATSPLFQRIPGRLIHTNILACALFGAVSGSSSATAAAVSSVSYPELVKRGYDKGFIIGSIAAGGTLGLLIPPSLALIIYGAWQEVSIGALFLAGIVPGLMIALMFSAYIAITGLLNPSLVPELNQAGHVDSIFKRILLCLRGIWPLGILIFAVLGTIYAGFATPTEAAGLGVFSAIILGFLVGELTFKGLVVAVNRSVKHFGIIAFVLMGAAILSHAVSIIGLPREIVEAVTAWELSKYELIVIVTLLYVVLGCIFEGLSLMILTLPFLYPVVVGAGFDPVWFGVYVTIMIEVGLITPPVGLNLYFLSAIAGKKVSMGAIAKSALPYWFLLLFATALIVAFPQIALFIPESAR